MAAAPRLELPTGTLTFLFSDIEGSTALVQQLGPRWTEALEQHHRLLRSAFSQYGGVEVASEGDSFFVAFPTASAAIEAAMAAQRAMASHDWPNGTRLRVRIGLHTGTASVAAGSYTGLDVHRAARVMAAGHGGQVLLSGATRALLADVPDGAELRYLGEHRLRGLSAPEAIYQLAIDGLPGDFPPLHSLAAVPNNLPVQLTSFLGRERELAQVRQLVEQSATVGATSCGSLISARLTNQTADRDPPSIEASPARARQL